MGLSFKEIINVFLVLMSIIDITGAIPIVIDMKQKGSIIRPLKVSVISLIVLIAFLFAGEGLLALFSVDVHSFAIAGAIILFVYGIEMTMGLSIIKDDSPTKESTIVPLVFPLIAGAGAMTTLVSLRADHQMINIIIAIILNMVLVYLVLKFVDKIEKVIGPGVIYVLRKIFGVILIAVSVKMFAVNLHTILSL